MDVSAAAFAEPFGEGWVQVAELLVAFVLSSAIGLERQLRGKNAGLRTQAIVGTASALYLLVSKYGFSDMLANGQFHLDPSRVAAQIVSGIGFLGAGLIITRRGAVHGLTTAAAVWETAAIGMAAAAGLPLLAAVVTALHFVVVLGFTRLVGWLPSAGRPVRLRVVYADQQAVLRTMLADCTRRHWVVLELAVDDRDSSEGIPELVGGRATGQPAGPVGVTVALSGPDVETAAGVLGGTAGVLLVERVDDDTE
jgi:putative Mg2+ transporter-C (MgtC) family protein